jgi:hypothetical protein
MGAVRAGTFRPSSPVTRGLEVASAVACVLPVYLHVRRGCPSRSCHAAGWRLVFSVKADPGHGTGLEIETKRRNVEGDAVFVDLAGRSPEAAEMMVGAETTTD